MSLSWGVLAGSFLGPYIYGIYDKKATKPAAYASMIGTLIITAVLYIISKTVPTAAPYLFSPAIGVITMVYSMIVMPIVSRLTKTPSPEMVEAAFNAAKKREKDQAKEIQEQA